MIPRVNLITLGVKNVKASRRFYELLGFTAAKASVESTVFMMAGGVVLTLYGHDDLAHDAGFQPDRPTAYRGMSLSLNVGSEAEVDSSLDDAVKAGAKVTKPGHRAPWGGYICYFTDPDGHLWEVAHNPFFAMDERGFLALP